jgi:mono/diheme cytochrome c family protein
MLQCMGCHTPDGSGEQGRVPSIKDTLAPFAVTPAGRRFLIQVPGASQSTLSDAELAELLNWMIQNLSVAKPTHFTQFTTAEVASYRRTPLVDVQGTRQRLLRTLPPH